MNSIKAIRGMNDILPSAVGAWQSIERQMRTLLASFGYEEIRPPIVERTELFRRSIGEITDIVEKEMYTFDDRNGDSLSLRPECTASIARAAIQSGLLRTPGQRVWAMGPMFRHERPQKGRYRQFHQLDVEILGIADASAEAELIVMSRRLWRMLGIDDPVLEVNSLGDRTIQKRYRKELVEYFSSRSAELDDDCRRRLQTNPLRILDSKNPAMQPLIEAAPRIVDRLDPAALGHFERLEAMLGEAGVEYRINPRLVRGLDYYTGTVFEWTTDALGAQSAVCGGGRYDDLIADIGGSASPAIGFAIGLERLVALLELSGVEPSIPVPHAYLAGIGEAGERSAHAVAERLRDAISDLRLIVDAESASLKAKLKRANRSGARFAFLLGEEEIRDGALTVRDLRKDTPQSSISLEGISALIAAADAAPTPALPDH
ncbi:histidine--tRNA ligase [Thioalkalivibrio sp. HK1]|uniref:histidine--tRNA ligase n=1 Tax=Thioalkalivibrio sp. HK1 TaxID=1469245 RepID=UPI000472BEB0|nr:histidine--tRNA ligase [Thioalkalivibrio sp. HK1]